MKRAYTESELITIDRATRVKPLSNLFVKMKEDFLRILGKIQKILNVLTEQELQKIFSFSQFRRICREIINQADLKYVYKFFGIEGMYTGGNILEHFLSQTNPEMWQYRNCATEQKQVDSNNSRQAADAELEGCKHYMKEMLDGTIDFILSMDIEFKLILKIGTYNHVENLEDKISLLFSYLDINHIGIVNAEEVMRVVH